MPSRFKLFWLALIAKIRGAAKWLIGATVAIIILIIALVGLNQDDNKKEDSSKTPEVAQVYEPSISTPLPADTTPSDNSGQVSGASTTTSSVAGSGTTDNSTTNASQQISTPTFTAPASGINPDAPIKYFNPALGVSSILPAKSTVVEKDNSVVFYSQAGSILYSIDVVATKDSLQTIMEQLKTSSDVSKLSQVTFAGNTALQFITKNLTGYAISKNNKAYYIMGDAQNLTNINL